VRVVTRARVCQVDVLTCSAIGGSDARSMSTGGAAVATAVGALVRESRCLLRAC
jgi:hypothetical protein